MCCPETPLLPSAADKLLVVQDKNLYFQDVNSPCSTAQLRVDAFCDWDLIFIKFAECSKAL